MNVEHVEHKNFSKVPEKFYKTNDSKKIAARCYGFYLPSRENALAKTNTMLTNFESKSNLICQKNFTKRMTLKCYKNFGEREGERFIK